MVCDACRSETREISLSATNGAARGGVIVSVCDVCRNVTAWAWVGSSEFVGCAPIPVERVLDWLQNRRASDRPRRVGTTRRSGLVRRWLDRGRGAA